MQNHNLDFSKAAKVIAENCSVWIKFIRMVFQRGRFLILTQMCGSAFSICVLAFFSQACIYSPFKPTMKRNS